MKIGKIPGCPACKSEVIVTEYTCPNCGITVKGKFRAGPFVALNDEQVGIVAAFLASSGNIKQMESRLGLSYPTVKLRLKEINRTLGLEEEVEKGTKMISDVINLLESGNIDVAEAIKQLEKEKK